MQDSPLQYRMNYGLFCSTVRIQKIRMRLTQILPNITYRCRWVWYRNLIVWTKFYKSSIVANLGEPVLYLLALGYGFSPLISDVNGVSYMQFLAPGLIAYTAMNAATYECTFSAYARMTAQKTYDAIISTPVDIDEVVAGEVLFGTTKAFFASLAMMVVLSLFTLFIAPLYFLSGIFFPLSTMPKWVTDAAWFNPLYHSVELSRGLVMGNLKFEMIENAAWLLIFGTLVFMYAVVRIRKRIIV